MANPRTVIDDLLRLMTGAASGVGSMREEMSAQMRQRLDRMADRLELVGREEFEVVREMIAAAREAQEATAERVARLEAEVEALKKARAPARPKRQAGASKGTASSKAPSRGKAAPRTRAKS